VQRFQPSKTDFGPIRNLGVKISKSFVSCIKENFYSPLRTMSSSAIKLSFLSLTLSASAFSQQFGGIRGQVVDSDFGQPIAKASVTIMGSPFGAVTDDQGNFTISGVPPGVYTIQTRASSYIPKTVPDISVAAGSFNEMRFEAVAEIEEMEELVVPGEIEKASETGLLAERQNASAVMDMIGQDFISRLGAANAGDAMKRMVGTSVTDGKYVAVRGMPDRYVNTLMNGGRLPSTDPDKRAINVDLFPGSILESINTYKTFTPDQPADFTGGSVDIRTRTFPDKPSFGAGFTVEYNSQATLNPDFLTYNGGGTGLFGGKANSREIPQNVLTTTTPPPGTLNFIDPLQTSNKLAEAKTVNSAMRQMNPVIGLTNKTPPPNMSFNLQGGDSIELGQYEKVGVIGAFSYRNKYSYYGNGTRGNLALIASTNTNTPGKFNGTNQVSQQMQGTQEVLWGGLIGLSGQWDKDHKASINVMYNRGADDNATQRSSVQDGGLQTDYQQIIDYGQRSLSYLQVIGEDTFEEARNFKINWNGGLGQAQLQEPDQSQFSYGITSTGTYKPSDITTAPGDTENDTLLLYQRQLTENSYYGIVDFTIPMFEQKERTDAFKTGFYQDYSQRDYSQSAFNYPYGLYGTDTTPSASYEDYTPTNGETWADVFLSPERSGLVNPTGAKGDFMMSYTIFNQAGDTASNPGTDYNASQGVTASYLMADFKPFPQLTLVGGARFENTNLKIFGATNLPARYFGDFNGVSKIQQLDLLPAVSSTFELTQGVNIRMAWSQTLARPSFKEMGPVITKDFTDDNYFLGNPQLQLSKANNYDFRVEWFPRAGEVISLSLFYKDLTKPLEQTSFYDQLVDLNFLTYQNASSGTIQGLEFEVRKRLDQLSSVLRQFSLFFNYTYIASSVPITGQAAEFSDQTTRPLQGQPEYVINAGLNYDNDEYRFYAGLFYNVTGPLLYAAGAPFVEPDSTKVVSFFPDVYQQPAPSLDFNITQGLTDNWKLTFRGKNLLNPWINKTQTLNGVEYIYSSSTKGWDVSLNAAYSF
jgi:TonB-dependent receptor